MEITGKPPLFVPPTSQVYKDEAHEPEGPQPDPSRTNDDTVDLSTHANEIREMVHKVNAMPDVREDKMAEMKKRIASGTYRILNDRIASHLVGETMENNAILNHIDAVDD